MFIALQGGVSVSLGVGGLKNFRALRPLLVVRNVGLVMNCGQMRQIALQQSKLALAQNS